MFFEDDIQERIQFWDEHFPIDPKVTTSFDTVVIGSWDRTEEGKLYKAFRGIQYGKVTRRFQVAEEIDDYKQYYYAQKEGPVCPQKPFESEKMNEECLFLNIYVPQEGDNFPVMVFIHGGAFLSGSGGSGLYGPQYLLDKSVILVTLNYRLGAFGFLSLENDAGPGNMGLRDQIIALKWIKNNIASFGGNSEEITIFGESAGAFSVMYQTVSPLSNGLFRQAIAQSGSTFGPLIEGSRPGKQRRNALALAMTFNCSNQTDESILYCLERLSTEEIITADYLCENKTCSLLPWDAVVDDYMEHPFLPDTPENIVKQGDYNRIPMILGVNSEEGALTASNYIFNESRFSEINNDWEHYGPLYIFDSWEPTELEISLSNVVKEFYLEGAPASLETIHNVIDMFSDIVFWVGTHR